MTPIKLFLILTIAFISQSCEFNQMHNEIDNLKYISTEMDADECKIGFVNEKNNLSGDTITFNYVKLNLINCKLYKKTNVDKALLSSYCAIKAYELFDTLIWKEKYGVNIVFDGEDSWPNDKTHFYKISELRDIAEIIKNSNAFLSTLKKVDTRIKNSDFAQNVAIMDTIETNDSLKIASYFTKELFEENNDLVLACYRAFEKTQGIEHSIKKYSFNKVSFEDTINSKVIKTEGYELNLSIILPENDMHYIKYLIKTDNINKFIAVEL